MNSNRRFQVALKFILLFVICAMTVRAQKTQYDRGTPPQLAAGVSPLGSYTSADLGTVNLSNGALNLKFPIGNVGGRGFWLPLTLNYSSKIWSGSEDIETDRDGSIKTVAYADFGKGDDYAGFYERLRPGWTVGVIPTLFNRIVRINYIYDPNLGYCYRYTLPKLTLMLPDKGEIEFRDDAYDGMPLPSDCSGYVATASRGHRWHATDGSGTIYISDIDNAAAQRYGDLSGVVITSDGTRYHFGGGLCDSITDRNGNKITIQGTTITDQLGRVTTIQQNVADPQNPSVTLALLVTLPGYNGQPRYYKVKTGVMSANYRSDITPTLPVITGDYDPLFYNYGWGTATRLFPKSYGRYAQEIDNWTVPTQLILPDGRLLQFKYNQYGEVAEVQMPTGGRVWYDYSGLGTLPGGNSPVWETTGDLHTQVFTDRALSQRRTFPDGSTLEGTWNYTYAAPSTQVTATSASGTLMLDQRHYFLAPDRYYDPPNPTGLHDGTQDVFWQTGIEYRTETRDAAGVILRATEQDWTQRVVLSWSGYLQEQLANDNRVNETRRYLDNGSFARTDTFYDPDVNYQQYLRGNRANNVSEVDEYDYDGSFKRRSVTSYANDNNLINGTNYTADGIHLVSLPLTQAVYDGSNNQAAQTVNEYDYYADDTNHLPLQTYPDYTSITQHVQSYGTAYSTRGNLTRAGRWLNLTNSFIYDYPRYDIVGNVVSAKDARGNVTSISFTDDFGNGSNPGGGASGSSGPTYSLPTLITSPPPNSGEPQQTARSQYDFSTGLLTGFKDRNGVVAQTIYNDPFDRPTQVNAALNTTAEAHTHIYYAPQTTEFGITLSNNDVLTARDQNTLDDKTLRAWTVTDGFGRTQQSLSRDPQGDVTVITIYDALGRISQVSNPFRSGETAVYTTTAYDLAGRVTSVTTPDNAVIKTAYSANRVLVADQNATDQLRRKRISVTDGLGRLKEVWEVNATDSATESVTFPGYPDVAAGYVTRYGYDTLDDLTSVSQRIGTNGTTQSRSFSYDSLKRLTSATNPESGTVAYQYDNKGNLLVKTDARTASAHYEYDALNRVTRRWYNGSNLSTATINNNPALPAGVGATDEIKYFYDSQTLPTGSPTFDRGFATGRLVATTYGGGSAGTYLGYDALGRPLRSIQQTGGVNYQTSAIYNLADAVKTLTYPSVRAVTNSYDTAGRTTSVAGYLGDSTLRTYTSGIVYSPFGGITKEQFGTTTTSIYNKLFYNSRGQLAEIRESTSYTGPTDTTWNRGAIINDYSASCSGVCTGQSMTDNNGNLKKQQHWIPDSYGNLTANFVQQYDYDSLNRLSRVADNLTTPTWRQQYTYDRYGNRTIDQANTFNVGIPMMNFGVDINTNRLTPPAGYTMSYDNAGNLTTDTYSGWAVLRTYDAENRMTKETQANSYVAGQYTYDGDGRRVKRIVGSTETWQVYGIGGELLAEYAANGNPLSPQKEYAYRNGQLLITTDAGANAPAPSGLTATPPSSGASINLSWSASSGATNYRIERKGAGGSYNLVGTTSLTTLTDNTATSGSAYLYKVCAANGSGNCTSGYSNVALGAAVTFATDPTICASSDNPPCGTLTPMRAAHITELRTAVNAVRTLAGLSTITTPNPAVGDLIGVNDVRNLRTKLGEALTALGIQLPNYTDTTLYGFSENQALATTIKAAHIRELRQASTSGTGGSGGGGSSFQIHWLVTDQLGTPRMIFDQSGSLATMSRHDYLPFGEELFAGTGGRTTTQGYPTTPYASDGARQKFTQKERDNETGLDYFGARYYASTQGRFTSADDFLNDTHITDPASWNLYTFVRNNPLRFVDPLGQDIEETQDKKHKLTKDEKKAIEKDLQAKTGLSSIHFDKNGKLTYDPSEKANGGSAQFRQSITGAINDSKNVFQIGDYSGSENIQFAETGAGATTTSNAGVTTYQVKIDFADFRDARNLSDSQALDAFSLGLNLYHEIDHKVSYDPSNPIPAGMATRPDISPGPGVPGVIDDVNVAQSQLGLASRAPGAHTGQRYNGVDPRLKNTYQIEFNASGKAKFLRWKLENQR
jgi:RHS repeat-associated protein